MASPDQTPAFEPDLTPAEQEMIREELAMLERLFEGLKKAAAGKKGNQPESSAGHDFQQDYQDIRNALRSSHEQDLPQVLAEMERIASLATHYRREINSSPFNPESPYFGHLRVRQDGRVRDVLIGNASLTSSRLPCPIIDWRHAPISKIYYAYREGDDYEEEIADRLVTGEVLARRTLTIVQGRLVRVDCDGGVYLLHRNPAYDQSEGKPQPGRWKRGTKPRPMLAGGQGSSALAAAQATVQANLAPRRSDERTVLGVNPAGMGRQDRRLPEITGLIDPRQFELISAPESGVVVVDGGAGSGKTTIALHRMAYLAYRDPERYKPSAMLAVVFNQALAEYVSRFLPALGLKGARVEVYEDFAAALRKRHFPSLPAEPTEATPFSVVRFKQHPACHRYLQELLIEREEELTRDIAAACRDTKSGDKPLAVWRELGGRGLVYRLERMGRWAAGQISLPGVGRFGSDWLAQQRLVALLGEALPDFSSPYMAVITLWEEAFLQEAKLARAMERLAPGEFSPAQIKEITAWSQQGQAAREAWRAGRAGIKAAEDENTSPQLSLAGLGGWDRFTGEDGEERENRLDPSTRESLEPHPLDREDDTLLLLLYREMAGPLRSQKQKPLRLAHLMVDEAQDFSPLELDLLLGLVDEPRSVTLAGDAAQKLFLHNGFNTWQDVLTHLGLKGTSIAPLKVGYRCTGEIMELAAHVLGPLAADRTWQATRSGAPVELLTFSDRGQAVAMLAQSLRLLAGREPSSYVCVIARHPQQAQLYYQGLAAGDVPRLRRVDRQNFAFAPGVEVTDITQVKGLEFDYVILLDVDTVNYPEDDPSRYMLHVGATRAAHQLWLVCCGQPSPLLPPALLETDL